MKKDFIYYMRILRSSAGYYKRLLQDYIGSFLVKNWKKIDSENIVSVNSEMLKDVFRIYNDNFDVDSTKMIMRYSKVFKNIFYIAKSENIAVGYCIYYIKPVFSLKGVKKTSVMYSIAVDKDYRRRGIGKKMLDHSIDEMRLNNVYSIYLYVDKENLSAINLYKSRGFKIIEEVKDICGEEKDCYKMELELKKNCY